MIPLFYSSLLRIYLREEQPANVMTYKYTSQHPAVSLGNLQQDNGIDRQSILPIFVYKRPIDVGVVIIEHDSR